MPLTSIQHRIHFSANPATTSTYVAGAALDDTTSFSLSNAVEPANTEIDLPRLPNVEKLQFLGSGGMGVVYRGRQNELKRTVAVKMLNLKHGANATALARFHSEAAAMAQLRHPSITQVFEYGSYDSSPYIVMEYVEGGTLADVIKAGPVPVRFAANLVETVAHAVQHAHDRAIIHRDLKPSNILLTKDGLPKVSDFGVAKLQNAELNLTQPDQCMGTPQYTAPEQLHPAGAVTTLVDIYSLGVILYELLTGHPPHQGKTSGEVIYQVIHVEPTPLRKLRREIPRDLETICLKCLDKDPAKRYHSAEALAHDLRCYQERMPITAHPISTTGRVWKWCRRHPLSAILTGWVVALLLIGTYVSFYFALWAIAESSRASQAEALINLERGKVVTANRRLEDQYDLVKKTNNFLQVDLLRKIAESIKQPDDANAEVMREALDHATEQISRQFFNQPDVEASLRQILGESYFHLGHTTEAIALLEKALEVRRTLPGTKGADALRDTGTLSQAYYKNNQFDKLALLLLDQVQAYLSYKIP